MSLVLKVQRNGEPRSMWYGCYVDGGKRKVVNLNVPLRGTPPASLSLRDVGDELFERSREQAELELQRYAEDARRRGRVEILTERLIESKTGRAVEYERIEDLAKLWRNRPRESQPTEHHLRGCDARFRRFVNFMRERNPVAEFLYEVTSDDAAAFIADIRTKLALSTVGAMVRLLKKSFTRSLPIGAVSPFADFVGGKANGDAIHRRPFSPEELDTLFKFSRNDGFMYPLIVTAACTGMRLGDVCRLRWRDVDLKEEMLAVKTGKTGARVEIPIYERLRAVLESLKGKDPEFAFPTAATMYEFNPQGLSWRFKKILAKAFGPEPEEPATTRYAPAEIEAEGLAAVDRTVHLDSRRERMMDTFRRYCAGQSFRQIAATTGGSKTTISDDLHFVQDTIGKQFLPVRSENIQVLIQQVTRVQRRRGLRDGSVRDWHALRATFVTLALADGVPVELVRRITGHATVEVVLENYFRPDREQFRAALANAMPEALTGGKRIWSEPAEELAAIAGKVAAGTATDEEKARLRELAAKV